MRVARIAGLLVIAACWAWPATAPSAGDRYLDALRSEVHEPAAPVSSDDSEEDHHDKHQSGKNGRSGDSPHGGKRGPTGTISFGRSNSPHCDDSNDFTAWMMFYTLTSPWWVPHTILESEDETLIGFPLAPYSAGHTGYLLFESGEEETPKSEAGSWGGRLNLDAGTNFDGVATFSGRLRIDTVSRFGVDTEWANLVSRNTGDPDWLGRGDCNLVVRFAQSRRAQFHSGIGINWLADRSHLNAGFNFTYGMDLFPVDPIVTSATLDLGKIGHAGLIHFRGTIGAMVTPKVHLYTGYDLLNLGGASIHSFLTGVEFWF